MKNLKHKEHSKSGIYKITCLSNGKFYIGSSKNIYYRNKRHLSELRKNKHKNPKLSNAFNKYGEDSFTTEIVEETDELLKREQYFMNSLNPYLNCVKLVKERPQMTLETREKLSKSVKKLHKEGKLSCGRIPVDLFDLEGNKLGSFQSFKACADYIKVMPSKISTLMSGKWQQWKGYRVRESGEFNSLDKLDKKYIQ